MAFIRIKLYRAYDSSEGGLTGFCVPDMFRALVTPVTINATKAGDVVSYVKAVAEGYREEHPDESFMPSVTILEGRKPSKLDAAMEAIERNWLKKEVK